jgi:hypothetical protein
MGTGHDDALRLDALEERFEAALALGEHAEVGVAIRTALEAFRAAQTAKVLAQPDPRVPPPAS